MEPGIGRAAAWTAMTLLSGAVALAALRYAIPPLAAAPANVAANAFAAPWLPLHAVAGAAALLLAPFQVLRRLRAAWPRLHRLAGRAYVAAVLVAGASGLVLALGTTAGPVAAAGFGLLALTWLHATARAWRAAVERRFAAHRRWMLRSFALTFAAVTLRLQLPLAQAAGVEFADAYRAIAWLCWLPNLLVVEAWLALAAQTRRI
jgi:uncharacterized membrane protein